MSRRKVKRVELKVGTLNVGTMTGKSRELADVMERRKVDVLCVQETRWKGEKADISLRAVSCGTMAAIIRETVWGLC